MIVEVDRHEVRNVSSLGEALLQPRSQDAGRVDLDGVGDPVLRPVEPVVDQQQRPISLPAQAAHTKSQMPSSRRTACPESSQNPAAAMGARYRRRCSPTARRGACWTRSSSATSARLALASGVTNASSPDRSNTAAVSAGETSSWMNNVTTSRGCVSIQPRIAARAGSIRVAPSSHTAWQRYGSTGPTWLQGLSPCVDAAPQGGRPCRTRRWPRRSRRLRSACVRHDSFALRPLPWPGVDQQGPNPVVELTHDACGLLGEKPPVLIGRRHRVVGGRIGNLVVAPVAQLGVAVAHLAVRDADRCHSCLRGTGVPRDQAGDHRKGDTDQNAIRTSGRSKIFGISFISLRLRRSTVSSSIAPCTATTNASTHNDDRCHGERTDYRGAADSQQDSCVPGAVTGGFAGDQPATRTRSTASTWGFRRPGPPWPGPPSSRQQPRDPRRSTKARESHPMRRRRGPVRAHPCGRAKPRRSDEYDRAQPEARRSEANPPSVCPLTVPAQDDHGGEARANRKQRAATMPAALSQCAYSIVVEANAWSPKLARVMSRSRRQLSARFGATAAEPRPAPRRHQPVAGPCGRYRQS